MTIASGISVRRRRRGPLGWIQRLLRRVFRRRAVFAEARPAGPPELRLALPTEDSEPLFSVPPTVTRVYRDLFRRVIGRMRRSAARVHRGRRNRVINRQTGRNFRAVPYKDGEQVVAAVPTLLKTVREGRQRLGREAPPIGRGDLLGWEKAERESMTLILVIDLSRSSHMYIRAFADILRSLTGHFSRNRDRMSLISLQGAQARILNHPTHNYRVVMNRLGSLKVQGDSPLSDGLLKALTMARLERYRNPGSKSLAVLLSDCFPEPLTMQYEDLFDEPAYRAALSAAHLFRRESVGLLVVNPSRRRNDDDPRPPTPGERLSRQIVRNARGRLIQIARGEDSGVPRKTLAEMIGAIEAAFQGGARAGQERSAADGLR